MAVFKWFRPGYELVDDRFEWNVQVPFLHTTDGTGQKLVSHLVPSQKKPNSQWQLSVSNRSKEILMMICHYNSSGEPSEMFDPVLWKIFLSNRRGRKVFQQMSHSNPDSSFVEFILSKEKIIKSECQQTDGSFTFSCKIISHMKIVPISSAYSPVRPVDCSSGLITHLEGLFDKMSFSDVNFNIGGREFPAHKSILTSRSPVFAAMFQHPTKENLSNQVVVEDIEPDVFQQLLRFIYTGRLSSTTMETMAAGLLIAADKYLIDELKMKCENYFLSHMSPMNCVQLLFHGDLVNPTENLKKAAKYFLCFPLEVMATDGWKKTKQENPVLLWDILEFVYRQ